MNKPTDPLSKVVIDSIMKIEHTPRFHEGKTIYWMLDWSDIDWIGAWLDTTLPPPIPWMEPADDAVTWAWFNSIFKPRKAVLSGCWDAFQQSMQQPTHSTHESNHKRT